MGLEALSRGASHVWLNEVNRVAFKVLEKNASNWQQKIGLLEHQRVQVMQLDFQQCLVRHKSNAAFWNEASICFFDPPWSEYALYQQFWESVQGFPGEIWVESDEQKGVSLAAQRKFLSQVIKEVTHGHHWLLVGKL
jgi:16S rRNA G966 N2-methylase RsmD